MMKRIKQFIKEEREKKGKPLTFEDESKNKDNNLPDAAPPVVLEKIPVSTTNMHKNKLITDKKENNTIQNTANIDKNIEENKMDEVLIPKSKLKRAGRINEKEDGLSNDRKNSLKKCKCLLYTI